MNVLSVMKLLNPARNTVGNMQEPTVLRFYTVGGTVRTENESFIYTTGHFATTKEEAERLTYFELTKEYPNAKIELIVASTVLLAHLTDEHLSNLHFETKE